MKTDWHYLILSLGLLAGCSGLGGGEFGESAPQDTPEEVRLKAILLEEDDIAGSAIDINIDDDRLVLEGFVEEDRQRERVEELMREHSELDEVENRIEVK
ncbi:MAG: BON domain-containing protein [Marinobacter sp.]